MPSSPCSRARRAPGSPRARRAPGSPRLPGSPCLRCEGGQAAVELVALLPLLAFVVALVWQLALAGHAVWGAGAAARAAARAQAVGGDAASAARAHLPRRLEHGLRVRARDDGTVAVSLRLPAVVAGLDLGRTTARARFEPQGG